MSNLFDPDFVSDLIPGADVLDLATKRTSSFGTVTVMKDSTPCALRNHQLEFYTRMMNAYNVKALSEALFSSFIADPPYGTTKIPYPPSPFFYGVGDHARKAARTGVFLNPKISHDALEAFPGVRIVTSEHLTGVNLDFSGCRSPGRAKRRYKAALRRKRPTSPHVKLTNDPRCYAVGDTIFMNPSAKDRLRARLERAEEEMAMRFILGNFTI